MIKHQSKKNKTKQQKTSCSAVRNRLGNRTPIAANCLEKMYFSCGATVPSSTSSGDAGEEGGSSDLKQTMKAEGQTWQDRWGYIQMRFGLQECSAGTAPCRRRLPSRWPAPFYVSTGPGPFRWLLSSQRFDRFPTSKSRVQLKSEEFLSWKLCFNS